MAFDAARLMLSAGLISEGDLARAIETQRQRGGALPRVCYELGVLDEARWASVLARALALPTIDLSQIDVDPAARGKVPEGLLRQLIAFPFQLRDGARTLVLAMAEPQDDVARAQLRAQTGCELKLVVAGYRQIERALDAHRHPRSPAGGGTVVAGARGRVGEPDFVGRDLGANETSEPALEGEEPAFAEAELVGEGEGHALELTAAERALLQALDRNTVQSSRAFQAALELCLERRLFSADELKAHARKN